MSHLLDEVESLGVGAGREVGGQRAGTLVGTGHHRLTMIEHDTESGRELPVSRVPKNSWEVEGGRLEGSEEGQGGGIEEGMYVPCGRRGV